MQEVSSNSTVGYASETITGDVTVKLTKTVNNGRTTVHGRIFKGSVEAGSVFYDSKTSHLAVTFRPFSALDAEEMAAAGSRVPVYVSEIIE